MKMKLLVWAVLSLGVAGSLVVQAGEGSGKGPRAGKGLVKDPAAREAKRFAAADTDHNGFLSLAEFKAVIDAKRDRMKEKQGAQFDSDQAAKRPTAEAVFARLDTDKSSTLSPAEMAAGGQKKSARREGRAGAVITNSCQSI